MKIIDLKYLNIQILPAMGFAIGIPYYGDIDELAKKEISILLFCIEFNINWK